MKVVGRRGEFLELSTAVGPEPSASECTRRFNTLFDFDLTLFVPPDAPMLVTRTPIERELEDGRRISVGSGAPVSRLAGPRYRVNAGGLELDMTLRPDEVGAWFGPPSHRVRSGSTAAVVLAHDARLSYGDGRELGHAERLYSDTSGVLVYGTPEQIHASGESLIAVPPAQRSERGSEGEPGHEERVDAHARIAAAGAPIYWADERRAGTVLHDHLFEEPATPWGRLQCHEVPMRRDMLGEPMRLCFEASDLRKPAAGTVASDAPLTKSQIRAVVRGEAADVRHCYGLALAARPDLSGRVVARFVIAGDGSVREAEIVDDEMPVAEVGRCIREAVLQWKFPRPRGGREVPVTYPFNLVPN
jgi:hypothetical protein